jgi:hypothetical protein
MARRIVALADEALAQVEATHRAVEELLAAVEGAQPARVVALQTGLDSARLVAIEMAVAGRSREEVSRHIGAAYEGRLDVEALLDDVFGPVRLKAREGASP